MADTPTLTQQFHRVVLVMINLNGGEAADDNSNLPRPAPASKASIEAMSKITVKESGGDCCICMEEFEVDEEAKEMPCKHVFHSGCIEQWLKIQGSCPVCRFLVPSAEVDETRGGEPGEIGRRGAD